MSIHSFFNFLKIIENNLPIVERFSIKKVIINKGHNKNRF